MVAGAGTLELRGDATVYGTEIKLKQLCRWPDADAGAFTPVAELVMGRFDKGNAYKSFTLEEVQNTLRDAGVNLGVIRFSGAMSCAVTRSDAAGGDRAVLQQWIDEKTNPGGAAAAAPATQPMLASTVIHEAPAVQAGGESDPNPFITLHDRLIVDLSQRLNLPVEQLQVNFDSKDASLLNLAEPNFHFDITAKRARDLGEVSWAVVISTGGGQQKVTVTANARAWQNQVVVEKPVAYHGVIQEDDIRERRVLIEHVDDTPVLSKSQVVGQEASRDLQTGMVLTARLVESVPLAKAGQYVTVTLNQGSIQLKTVAKAMESGSFGQSIRVKNEGTKDIYEVTLTGPQSAMMGSGEDPRLAALER